MRGYLEGLELLLTILLSMAWHIDYWERISIYDTSSNIN